MQNDRPLRVISSAAPIRIADFGGWSDTWFAKFGRVLNIAVFPLAEVQMRVFTRYKGRPPLTIYAENYGERYTRGWCCSGRYPFQPWWCYHEPECARG